MMINQHWTIVNCYQIVFACDVHIDSHRWMLYYHHSNGEFPKCMVWICTVIWLLFDYSVKAT